MDKLTWFLAALAVAQTFFLVALWRRPAAHRPDEGADDAVDGDAPAFDHHPRLAGRDEDRPVAGRDSGVPKLEGDGHLADRA